MRPISKRRHARALRKELAFWGRKNILALQEFRIRRYTSSVLLAADRYGLERIENVLEVGCGPACVADHIPAGRKWYLDPLLAEYDRLFPGRFSHGVKLPVPFEEAELKEGFFDVILMLNTLDHVRDPWVVLAKTKNSLRPGGVLILSCYVRRPLMAFLRNAQERLHCSTDLAHPFTFTQNRVERDLQAAGFKIESTFLIDEGRVRSEFLWTCSLPTDNQ